MSAWAAARRFLSGPGLPLKVFLGLCCAFVVVSRLGVIAATPRFEHLDDIEIYHSVGKVLNAGLDLYNPQDHPAIRAAIRQEIARDNISITQSPDFWEFALRSNLPASNALFWLFEVVSGGSLVVWRLLFIVGDLALLGALFWFVTSARGPPVSRLDQLAIAALTCVYPSLIISGTAVPEDKQLQTALLLASAALLIGRGAPTAAKSVTTGLVLSVSVLFKFFGAFLLPLYLARYWRAGPAAFARASIAGLIPLGLSLAYFGPKFVSSMGVRAGGESTDTPLHSSPWVLLAGLDGTLVTGLRLAATLGMLGWLSLLLWRARIDLLNWCAGVMLIFACIWLTRSDMYRMNIAMMFATATLITLSAPNWRAMVLGNTAFQAVAYPALYALLGRHHLEQVHALVTAAYLTSYLGVLTLFTAGKSPAPEGVARA